MIKHPLRMPAHNRHMLCWSTCLASEKTFEILSSSVRVIGSSSSVGHPLRKDRGPAANPERVQQLTLF
jgi:hypothetical protein